jgi:hypothetical protein
LWQILLQKSVETGRERPGRDNLSKAVGVEFLDRSGSTGWNLRGHRAGVEAGGAPDQYRAAWRCAGGRLFRLVTQPGDEAVATPKFDLAAIDKPPGPVDRLGIIGAQQRLEPYKMPIKPDRINPVFRQPQSPPQNVLVLRARLQSQIYCNVCPVPDSENPHHASNGFSKAGRLTRLT